MYVGSSELGSTVDLKDRNGKSRLRLNVSDKGEASIIFVDANEKPIKTLTAAKL